jgi:hypothetical protein
MDIPTVIREALRGHAPRTRGRQTGGLDDSPAVEFLEREVWPLLKGARQSLERSGIIAVALAPSPSDDKRTHALLILQPGKKPEDACSLRFMVIEGKLHVKVSHPQRNDPAPVLLDPAGSVTLIHNTLEEFIFHCLAPLGARKKDHEPGLAKHRSQRAEDCCHGLRLKTA